MLTVQVLVQLHYRSSSHNEKQVRAVEYILDNTDSVTSTPSEKAERELHTYASELRMSLKERNPLVWWKVSVPTYKYLTKLVKCTLTITTTSVPSERLFSSAPYIDILQKR